MKPTPYAVSLILMFAAVARAQSLHLAGTMQVFYANSFTRGIAGSGAGELIQRFDADDMRGFGIEPAFPGVQIVRGVWLQRTEVGGGVADGGAVVTLYTEDPLRPNYPDLQFPLVSVPASAAYYPPTPTLFGDTYFAMPFPVPVPIGRDVFVGYTVNATTSQFGGRRLNFLSSNPAATLNDQPGAGLPSSPPEEANYRLFRNTTTDELTYLNGGQFAIDLLTSTPGGCATARTNQSSYAFSGAPTGTTSMLSGLHPDAAFPPRNPGRADDVGFFFVDQVMATGDPVLFLASLTGFGPIMPLDQVVPGSVGGLCLPEADLIPLVIVPLAANDTAYMLWTIEGALRPSLLGMSWVQQAIGLDSVNGVLRGSMCVRQRF